VRGVVVTGGAGPCKDLVTRWSRNAKVVAADSGLGRALECGVKPDLAVGDFDSLADPRVLSYLDENRVRRYPREKDQTDTEIALDALRELGCDELVILGGGGGRLDHLIGILSLFDRTNAPNVWITDTAVSQRVDGAVRLSGTPGSIVSVFPLGCGTCRATSRGLRWPLDGLVWRRGDIGVSNEFVSEEAEISVESGSLLVVRELEA
jgi:thiamine pyrophosphokinase